MIENLKKIVIDSFPPFIVRSYQRTIKGSGYFGNYEDWQAAKRASIGYDTDLILQKVRDSLMKVKNGDSLYERDSVVFNEIQYSWPLLSGLLWIASCNGNCLNLLDFGGSLGSSYFQNRSFLSHLSDFSWSIVEQEKFVLCGRELFEDKFLRFYFKMDECCEARNPDTILLGSVLQYLENPFGLLKDIFDKKFSYILFDRTAFIQSGHDRLTIQKVPPEIYPASYPAWFFSLNRFKLFMSDQYDLIAEFNTNDQANFDALFKGFIYKRRLQVNG